MKLEGKWEGIYLFVNGREIANCLSIERDNREAWAIYVGAEPVLNPSETDWQEYGTLEEAKRGIEIVLGVNSPEEIRG